MDDSFYDEQFALRGLTPEVWVLSARRLKKAADIVFRKYEQDLKKMEAGVSPLHLHNLELSGCATLLYGLAIENILKALIIKRSPEDIKNGKLRKWPADGHEQLDLAREAKLTINDKEKDILKRLSGFVRWVGRYPIPKSSDKMRISQNPSTNDFIPLPLEPAERTEIHGFYMKLESLF